MNLDGLRTEIDRIDGKVLKLIAKRLKLCSEISEHKRKNRLKVLDKGREAEIIRDRISKFQKLGFEDQKFVKELFRLLMNKSKEIQKRLIKRKGLYL
ncbi:MAG: chorismate mutase [Nanoarchaeota archaeon]|nr:chorismate mutase [Nanoarchaeota archaeon]MBU1643682.1 chorismate mutase [Nanoarchaeota archaeon]MBU1976780.1 chorismate mutase [Nanoarchaeota archaeon]